jgi:predicted Zn-dependent peptidase
MHIQETTLKNNLRIVTCSQPDSPSCTLMVGCRAGSRFETKAQSGISHFIEHMFFKGGERYPTAKSVSEAVDRIGGNFNAFTGKEYVGYYIKAASDHLNLCFDVLSDMMCHATFDATELEKEKTVIIEEIKMYDDQPSSKVYEIFDRELYGDNSIGWDIAGTIENVSGFTRDDLLHYKNTFYTGDNLIITVTGNVDHTEVVALCKQYFESIKAGTPAKYESVTLPTSHKNVSVERDIQQTHLLYGCTGYHRTHEDIYALRLLTTILGGNMSSRLFQQVREEQGLCYTVYTMNQEYTDHGDFACYTAVAPERQDEALKAIQKIFAEVAEAGITEIELKDAKSYYRGKTALSLENNKNIASLFMKQTLLSGKVTPAHELLEKYDKVTVADIQRVASDILTRDFLTAVVEPKNN